MFEKGKIGLLILAGGMSERMMYPKPWLQYNKRQTFLEKIVDEYTDFGVDQTVLVINEKFCESPWQDRLSDMEKNLTLVKNDKPEKGKSYSVHLGLKHIVDCSYLFLQNIDNPFVDRKLLSALFSNRSKDGYAVPLYKEQGGHPILISKKIIEDLRQLDPESLNIREVLRKYFKIEVSVSNDKILANINSKEDYEVFFKKEKLSLV